MLYLPKCILKIQQSSALLFGAKCFPLAPTGLLLPLASASIP